MGTKKPQSIGKLLLKFDIDKKKYISREWQDYAYRLALSLDDIKNKSLYMKLAKDTPRAMLEEAKNFVTDARNVKNKGKLFMWKLKEIKQSGGKKQKPATFKRVKVLIEGKVQAVGFRYWLKGKADELRLKGWVTNLPDGKVEAAFEGTEEKVNQLLEACRKGPSLAKIKKVAVNLESWRDDKDFVILKG